MRAVQEDHVQCLELLLQRGADMNAKDKEHGRTALDIAKQYENTECVALLKQYNKTECVVQ